MIHSPICNILGIEKPLFQGGMAWIADARLAAAVSEAGGLGLISSINAGTEAVRAEIRKARERTAKPFGVNIMLAAPNAAEIADRLKREGLRPDAVVVDPPRKGLAESVVRDIAAMRPDRVVYISCNPSTLARDVARFNETGYCLSTAEAYDMFPKTSHIETVALLYRQKKEL